MTYRGSNRFSLLLENKATASTFCCADPGLDCPWSPECRDPGVPTGAVLGGVLGDWCLRGLQLGYLRRFLLYLLSHLISLFLQYAPARCAAAQASAEQGVLPPCHHHEAVHDPQLVPCTCPLFSCPWEGHLEVVVSHLRQTHRINILQGAEIVFLATDMHLPAPTDWIIMHSCLGHQFLLVLRKQEKYEGHPQFFATMMLIGTPTQADNFTYRLELNRNQRRLKWEATPRSVLERVDSVISDGDCLVLNTSLAQLFSDNGSLAIGIAITTSKVHNAEAEMWRGKRKRRRRRNHGALAALWEPELADFSGGSQVFYGI